MLVASLDGARMLTGRACENPCPLGPLFKVSVRLIVIKRYPLNSCGNRRCLADRLELERLHRNRAGVRRVMSCVHFQEVVNSSAERAPEALPLKRLSGAQRQNTDKTKLTDVCQVHSRRDVLQESRRSS